MSKKILKTKVCVAEYCTNTSDSSEKIFISVPTPAQKEFKDFSHLTGDVVTDAMRVSIQTCDIFSQEARKSPK